MWGRRAPYIWDNYLKGEVPTKLKLWSKVWQNLWEDDHNHYYYLFEPTGFRALIEYIKEISTTSRRLQKPIADLKDRVNQSINYVQSVDEIGFLLYDRELKQLKKYINSNGQSITQTDRVLEYCEYMIHRMNQGEYFSHIYKSLHTAIFSNSETSVGKLKNISQLLAVEYLAKGFAFHTVIDIPENLFNKSRIQNNEELGVFKGKYWGTNLDFILPVGTNVEDRFNNLQVLYNAPEYDTVSLFLILGASCNGSEQLRFGNILFRSPLPIEADESGLWVFRALEKDHESKPFLRASIPQRGVDCYKMLENASTEIQKAVSFLKYRYRENYGGRWNLDVSRSWALLNPDGTLLHQMPNLWEGIPNPKPRYKGVDIANTHKEDIKLTEEQVREYGLQYDTLSTNKIYDALHWIEKTRGAKSVEDYFMEYWIALEYLVRKDQEKTYESLMEFVPSIAVIEFFDEIIRNLHDLLQSQMANGYLRVSDQILADKYGLSGKLGVYTWSTGGLCSDLPEIIGDIGDHYVETRAREILDLSTNRKLLLDRLRLIKQRVRFDLQVIYQIRNDMVHSARVEQPYISYYARRLRDMVDQVLGNVMFYLQYFPNRKIGDILTRLKLISELYVDKIENDPAFDIYDHRFFQ